MNQPVYSVSQVNRHVRGVLDGDPILSGIFVRGELSNYKTYPSGHHYFSMKDESGALKCVMFRGSASTLRFRPQNGMMVVAYGRVEVYERDGVYQLIVSHMAPDGVGDLQVAFEQLKEKLAREGLFDESHKKPIPRFPGRIALVTSPAGAAVRDMIRILGARWPMAEVYVVPCRVQGMDAPPEIAGAIRWVNERGLADLIITGRGGGSMEDLWCFNDERVARAIYDSRIPVISAVGHEPDVTIADYVADLRAATPSNGAELAVVDQNDQYILLDQLSGRMAKAMERRIGAARALLERAGEYPMLRDPMSWVTQHRDLLDRQGERMARIFSGNMTDKRQTVARLAASLDALSPLAVLGRGYAIARTGKGVVKSVKDVKAGDRVALRVSDGEIPCVVKGES